MIRWLGKRHIRLGGTPRKITGRCDPAFAALAGPGWMIVQIFFAEITSIKPAEILTKLSSPTILVSAGTIIAA
ncbi:MAG: hypothetical protein WED15_06805 [Akkermansiaceae bacterium]